MESYIWPLFFILLFFFFKSFSFFLKNNLKWKPKGAFYFYKFHLFYQWSNWYQVKKWRVYKNQWNGPMVTNFPALTYLKKGIHKGTFSNEQHLEKESQLTAL